MSRSFRILFVFLFCLAVLITPTFRVLAADANATNVARGLKSFVLAVNEMGFLTEEKIPFTAVSITEVFSLNDLFSQTLGAAIGGTNPDDVPDYDSLAHLRQTIEEADTIYNDVHINFTVLQLAPSPTDNSLIDLVVSVTATRTLTVPLNFIVPEKARLDGGGIPLDLALETTLHFQYDSLPALPADAFYLTEEPILHLHLDADSVVSPFPAQLALADIQVSGNIFLNIDANIYFHNPDSGVDPYLTRDEWEHTALIDLLTAGFVDEPGDAINATLHLEALDVEGRELIPGSPDASITLVDDNLSDGLNSPDIQLASLGGFANLSRDEMLTGVAQLATALVSAQIVGDFDLPFMRQYLSDVFFFAQPLIDFVERQGAVDIVCGTQPGSTDLPPTGDIFHLVADDTVYCRAFALEDATTVSWAIVDGTVEANGVNPSTVGTNPTADAVFTVSVDGRPQISVLVNDSDTFVPRFQTVQEMFTQLQSLGGFPLDSDDINYDPATTALTFHLSRTLTPEPLAGSLDFGNQMKKQTSLAGLTATGSASATIIPEEVALDVTFGILLADGLAIEDRFFLQTPEDEPEFRAGATVSATVDLTGLIGFVGVTAVGDAGQNPAGNEAFVLGPSDPSHPMLTLDINAPGIVISPTNPTPIPNAIRLRTLLDDPGAHLTAHCNVSFSAGLTVNASLSGNPIPVGGGVGLNWPDTFYDDTCEPNLDNLQVQPSLDYAAKLQGLDTSPSLFGSHTGSISSDTLTDNTANFLSVGRDLVGVRLSNHTDGSSCVITNVTATTLTCESGLQGGKDNEWKTGNRYEVAGNPYAMLNLILDNLDFIVSQIDNLTGNDVGGVLDAKLPLLSLSPNDLISQYRTLKATIDEIRTGEVAATIQCGPIPVPVIDGGFDMNGDGVIDNNDNGDIQGVNIVNGEAQAGNVAGVRILAGRADINNDGEINDLDVASRPAGNPFAVPPGFKLYCHAITSQIVSDVEWMIVGGTSIVTGNGTNPNTVGQNPTALAEITLNYEPSTQSFNYRVIANFTNPDGKHVTALPSFSPPPSLQALEELIESKLSLPPTALTFELVDLPAAGQPDPDGTTDLVMRLGYGICTSNNSTISTCVPGMDRQVDPLDVPINLDLGNNLPGLVGLTSSFEVEYIARARFEFGLSLETVPKLVVLNNSGVTLEAGATLDDVGFNANVGPISLLLGDSAAVTGTHNSKISSTTTLTDTVQNFADAGVMIDDRVANVTDGSWCTITAVTDHTLTCVSGLGGGNDNTWEAGDHYAIGGNGVAKLSAGFSLASSLSTPTANLSDFVGSLNAALYPVTPGTPPPCKGDACAALSMGVTVGDQLVYLGDLTFSQNLDGSGPGVDGMGRLPDRIAASLLDWRLLFRALPELLEDVKENLKGAANNVSIPLVGDALDGGAEVAHVLRTGVVDPIYDNLGDLIEQITNEASNAGELETLIENYLNSIIDPSLIASPDPIFAQDNSAADIVPSNVVVTTYCQAEPLLECADNASLLDIVDVRIKLTIERNLVEATPTFNVGIPGVPLRSGGGLHAAVNWKLLLHFGFSKNHGPYLVAHDINNGHGVEDDELELRAEIEMADAPPEIQEQCNKNDPITQVPPGFPSTYSDTRCLFGEIAFMQVHLRDRLGSQEGGDEQGEASNLSLKTGLNITKDDADVYPVAYITFQDLVNGNAGLSLTIAADAHIDLRLRTGLNADLIPGFPSVFGTFQLDWDRTFSTGTVQFTEFVNTPLTIRFDNLYIDAGAFVSQFLGPIAASVQNITSPLMPVIETVSAPLPVLSDLSRMVGQGDISLMSLMERTTGVDLTLVRRIFEFIRFANSLEFNGTGPVWIGLGPLLPASPKSLVANTGPGKFELRPELALTNPPTSGKQRQLINTDPATLKITSSHDLQIGLSSGLAPGAPGPFGVSGLTFPFTQEPMQIFALLLGEDATLVRYDAGTVRATASLAYTYRFAVGPIPMSVALIGSATLEGRFAMGYDTYGIRQVVNGGKPAELLNGIFLDDLDNEGNDVPEITLKGRIAARAAVDIVIVSAGVEGGIELTVSLNLDDRPEPDGKLRLNEIANKLSNPICLFEVSGKLEAYFAAFVKIKFLFVKKEYRFELARVKLLDFSAACDPPPPKLAKITDDDELVLLMGSLANRQQRGIAINETNEKFTVRMLEDGRVSVSAFGVYQTFCCNFSRITANGDNGNDFISLEAGATIPEGQTEPVPIPFTIPAYLRGGDGNDELRGGDANDEIWGGPGNDKINGGGGHDILRGEAGNDAIDGGLGNDHIYGGDNDDRLNGGPGADHIEGGGGDDQLAGGPGTAPGEGTPDSEDLADALIGGPGSDSLAGGFGADVLFGDSAMGWADGNNDGRLTINEVNFNVACDENSSTPGQNSDQLKGDDGDDYLFGGPGNDELTGAGGHDTLCGNGDDDILCGDGDNTTAEGDDHLYGGNGHDKLDGQGGHDWLDGQNGNDTLDGGPGHDDLIGGHGRDLIYGSSGNDIILGDNGAIADHSPNDHTLPMTQVVQLVTPGNAAAFGPAIENCQNLGTDDGNADCIFGGDGNDFTFGEGGHDHLFGDNGDDYMEGNAGNDVMRGGWHNDFMHGNDGEDEMYGDSGIDIMYGDAGNDTMRGNAGDDLMFGNAGDDFMHGDADNDEMYGNRGNDEMYGDSGDDYMEGNEDSDLMFGGAGQDDMIGGSSASFADDASDEMQGGPDHDVMAGDNATITRPGGVNPADGSVLRIVVLHNLAFGNSNTNLAGPDVMHGNSGNDQMYGQGENDLMHGNDGDDYMEGNGGDDVMHGDEGQDDLIGGSAQEQGGTQDGSDTIYGGSDYDVILGDNAAIVRPVVNGQWVINTFNDAVAREITLFDVATTTYTPPAHASGGDLLYGDAGDDLMYGQGNADDLDDDGDGLVNEDPVDGVDNDGDGLMDEDGGGDYMHGGDGDDYMEGNAGADWLFGDGGNDDMVGGTGRINEDPETGTDGRLDGGDTMFGGTGYDVMAGDNALLVRTLVNGQWQGNTYNDGIQHEPRRLLDVDSPDTAVVSGGDTMYGNEQDDLMYGQGGNDLMFGNEGDDFMEGNAGSDTMHGNEDQDDMIGGTVEASRSDEGDIMYGGDHGDVMLGDNGTITRPLDSNGRWRIEPNTGDEVRDIQLFDIETVTSPGDPAVSGSDIMYGDGGRDYMFGQGNDEVDADGDGRFNEDPPDGIDNDRDGREGPDSVGYDCLDGIDNDGDGLVDGNAPDCTAAIDEDGGGDEMYGGDGDDYMEGNHGSDWMFGNGGEDDMIGGSSAGDGHIFSGILPAGLRDGHDVMRGGDDDDQMVGDNAMIVRPTDGNGFWQYLDGFGFHIAVRIVTMIQVPESSLTFGHDYMLGGDGHDEMYGQLGADYMEGNGGEDAILGDLGLITSSIEDGSREQVIATNSPFLEDTIYAAGTLYRLVTLYSQQSGDGAEWNDIMLGGDGNDSIHGGAGDDLANGNGGEDHIFGGDGNDVLWGGPGHDHLWGGHHNDYLDVKPRPATDGSLPPPGPPQPPQPADPPEWFTYGGGDNYQEFDIIYGGWDQDAMQADVGGPGPVPGDRLLDWVGGYNVYYTCPAAYGEGVITRSHSPQVIQFLQKLAEADGAITSSIDGSSGFRELGMVFPNQGGQNSHPPHPDHPGHFTCN